MKKKGFDYRPTRLIWIMWVVAVSGAILMHDPKLLNATLWSSTYVGETLRIIGPEIIGGIMGLIAMYFVGIVVASAMRIPVQSRRSISSLLALLVVIAGIMTRS